MIIFVVGIILILYGVISKQKYSVWIGMFFVFLIMGFQEGVPGDYQGYQFSFNSGGSDGYSGGSVKTTEFSFIWITTLLSKIMGFHGFVFLTSAIQCVILAIFIKKYVGSRFHRFGVLLVFFTTSIMLLQMKAMRQGYAVEMLVLAYILLDNRKYLLSIVSALIAIGFHNSSLVVIPFYLVLLALKYKNSGTSQIFEKETKNHSSVFLKALFFTGSLFVFYILKNSFFNDYINPYLASLNMFEYSEYLDQYADEQTIPFLVFVYYSVILFFTIVYYIKEQQLFKKYSAFLTIVFVFFTLSVYGFGNLLRISMYFVPFTLVVFPNIANMLRVSYGKKAAWGFILFNLVFLMKGSIDQMLSDNYDNGTGFYSYTFSFLNW